MERGDVDAKVRAQLEHLEEEATVCAGMLSRKVGSTLKALRPELERLARSGEIAFYQRGRRVEPDGLRGPFRVRLP